ncbi:Sec-independent protein translocase subunit TatA [Phycicoccus sonneratiae]|uniref:Sec-independent protein translocase protein TatA n=1 Tax=Phycicoccus sonneratiae TaxID=2807628 RepID=A0ABS2CIF5_9MICO|nr:Sec-independent protein translocase subunit TatA [Phycicoccus sonneraticus]MBM6399642.1 Sec-independent protein translocase subunit TatA [Phycicoccus sonneraticus]
MGRIGPTEIIIIAVLVIVVFGWKRLPDAARSLGRSARVFKSEVDEMKKENEAGKSSASAETVRGESITQSRPVDDDVVTPDPNGNAVHEKTPRTDNQSGPVA